MAKANRHHRDLEHDRKNFEVVVVMVPFPAQGHLNQLLQLSRLISSYNISVHFIGTSIHNRQAKLRVHGCDPTTISHIHFHDFEIPSFQSPPPNPNAPIKFPSHLQPSFEASCHLRKPVAALLEILAAISRRVIVIHDTLMASVVQDFISFPNAESYTFRSISAFSSFWFFWEVMGRPFQVDVEMQNHLPTLEACFTAEFAKLIVFQQEFSKLSSGSLYNASRLIEGKFLDLLEKEPIKRNKKLWAIGPLNPVASYSENNIKSGARHKCLDWLDNQCPKSVLFVSFGTTTSLTDEQITELAIGLERREVKFIWVLRDADKGDIFAGDVKKIELPKGFEQRVINRGMIVRDWAPQLEILKHPSTGGFMSHCGWNSCMESISNGVPIAAWPMHSDQPRNCMLITKVLKVGIVVRDWASKDEVVKSSTIENVVKGLMASEEGAEARRRAAELGSAVRKSVEEGGVTRMELDSFVAHITRC